jgi:biotin-(acetyl-CoA carboxylase) ligase
MLYPVDHQVHYEIVKALQALQIDAHRVTEFERIGFQGQKDEFLGNSFRYGEALKIRLRGDRQDEHNGVFEGINNDGALILKTADGIQKFVAGDIFPTFG